MSTLTQAEVEALKEGDSWYALTPQQLHGAYEAIYGKKWEQK